MVGNRWNSFSVGSASRQVAESTDDKIAPLLVASRRRWHQYNARFPPTVAWVMPYDPEHSWEMRDDYFGGSLLSWVNLFEGYDYFLVACSAQGANAFFVHERYRDRFLDCPNTPEDLYQAPFYALAPSGGTNRLPATEVTDHAAGGRTLGARTWLEYTLHLNWHECSMD